MMSGSLSEVFKVPHSWREGGGGWREGEGEGEGEEGEGVTLLLFKAPTPRNGQRDNEDHNQPAFLKDASITESKEFKPSKVEP